MAKVQVLLGSAARKELFFALDSASTTGAGKTGASGTMAAFYCRNDTTPTATSIASPAFTEVSSANMPGVYHLTVPVGAFAAGATTCVVMITGTGMAPVTMEYQLVAFDPNNATSLGLTNLDAQVSTRLSSTGSISSLTGNLTGTVGGVNGNVTGSVNSVTTGVTVTTNNDKSSYSLSASQTFSTTGSVGSVTGNVSGSVGSIAANGISSSSIANSAITIRMSGDATPSNARIVAGSIATDVWLALVHDYDATSSNTTATFAKAILRSDAQTKNGDVTMYSVSGTNGIDVDIHRIANDQTAATALKNALTGVGGTTITATLTALDVNERIAIADTLLARDIGSGTNAGTVNERTVRSALRALRNKSSISGSLLTVKTENDTNDAWTASVSSDAAAIPVTGIDPV